MKRYNLKHLLLIVLSIAILMSSIACSSADKSTEETNTAGTAAEETNKSDKTAEEATESLPPLEINFMSVISESIPDMNNKWWTNLQEKTNTRWKIDWVPAGDYGTKFDLVLASGQLPDVILAEYFTRSTLVSAIKNGAFWDLTPVLGDFSKYPNLKNNTTDGAWNYVKVDKKIWGIPRSRPQIDHAIKIRKDWLDKLGIPMPKSLDEYKEALVKITGSDPDGNGKNDTIGLVGAAVAGSPSVINFFDRVVMNAFGCYDLSYDADNGLVHPYLKDECADFIGYVRELYDAGCISKEFSLMKISQAEELFTSGRAASFARSIFRDYTYEDSIKKVQPDAVVETIPYLEGPKHAAAYLEPGVYGAFYINKKIPEAKMLRIMDFYESTCTPEWTDVAYFGLENVHYTLVSGQKTLNELGKTEIGTQATVQQPLTLTKNNWAKVLNPAASKEYNDAKNQNVSIIGEKGQINKFEVMISDTWTKTWPKFQNDYESYTVKAIVGNISMDQYRAYLKSLRDNKDFKQAFQEFAKAHKDMFE